jgi:rRNA maturation protein Nop10
MEIEKPTWQAKQICPHCGQGHPTFCFCTKCGFLTLMCDETGDIFKNPKNLNEGVLEQCPACGQKDIAAFETADSDQILKAGFTKDDYE